MALSAEELDYIDKLFARINYIGRKAHRHAAQTTVLTVLILLIAFKGIIIKSIGIAGVGIEITPILLEVALSVFLIFSQYMFFYYTLILNDYEDEFIRVYPNHFFNSKSKISKYDLAEHPLAFRFLTDPTFLETRGGKVLIDIIGSFVQILLVFVPILSIICACALTIKHTKQIWVIFLYTPLIVVSSVLVYSLQQLGKKGVKSNFKPPSSAAQ